MTDHQSAHLSPEALDDLLIGLGTPESQAHLVSCPDCDRRVSEFHVAMGDFNRASLGWAEARPRLGQQAASRLRALRIAASPWSWVLAVAVLFAVVLPIFLHRSLTFNNTAVSTSEQGDSDAQIAQDNDLLRSVNVVLNEGEESPIAVYHLSKAPHPRLRARPELRKQ